ncbi:MAG TPA: AAA family ATPase, partial [Sphingomicrobium sp.]
MTWKRVDLAAEEFDRPSEPPAVGGLLYRGKRHAISGPPEATKTIAALILGLEWRRSGLGDFALIDFEMGEHATRRLLDDLGASLEEIAAVYYVTATSLPDADDIDALEAKGVTLAIIDSAAGAYGVSDLDDNKRSDAEQFSRFWIAPLWTRGITTLVLDHVV